MQIQYKNSFLTAVPAVHYNPVFADQVNLLCSDPENSPDAIVVELGATVTSVIYEWMKELGIRKNTKTTLPCMLGLITENNLMHPKYKEPVTDLQLFSGKGLQQISPEILNQLFDYSSQTMICLSSTDSIIEAIRCAIELEIPVFGIDMEKYAKSTVKSVLYENPFNASADFDEFIVRNEIITSSVRDTYIDERREIVMASHIKAVLEKYKKVLYTGGIAHWHTLKKLISNDSVLPVEAFASDIAVFRKVIIHPEMAYPFVDGFPVISTLYENYRIPAGERQKGYVNIPDKKAVGENILQSTIQSWLEQPIQSNRSQVLIPEFRKMLVNYSLTGGKNSPDMFDMLTVAQSMMPEEFCRILENQLMDIGRPWASQKDFPAYPVIESSDKLNKSESEFKAKLITPATTSKNQKGMGFNYSSPFYYRNLKTYSSNLKRIKYWKWIDQPKSMENRYYSYSWIWPPCECLMYGTALQTAKNYINYKTESESVIFEGSVYEGLDIKTSMRSIIKGENKFYVRIPNIKKQTNNADGKNPEPAVFIFSDSEKQNKAQWNLYTGGTTIGYHVSDLSKFKRITKQFGNIFIASVAFETYLPVTDDMSPFVTHHTLLSGITLFGNPCINSRQSAQWVEESDYKCCPVIKSESVASLQEMYLQTYHISFSGYDWKNMLIWYAIPFCKTQMFVFAPDGFKPHPDLYRECRKRKLKLELVPLSNYPDEKIKKMQKRYSVKTNDDNGFIFNSEVEFLLGERSDNHLDMLPPHMQKQLKNFRQ